jgi:hypothetical protein
MVLQMVRGCGYGTPSPLNPLSQLWYSISALSMSYLFAYCTKHFIDIFLKFYEETDRHRRQLTQLKIFAKEQAAPGMFGLKFRGIVALDRCS